MCIPNSSQALTKIRRIHINRVLSCSALNIITWQVDLSGSFFVLDSLGDPSLLCLLGSRMFLNLKNAGETEVKDDMSGGYRVGTGSILSDPQFADVANRQTGMYILSLTSLW